MEDPTKLDSSGNENKTAVKGNTTGNTHAGDFVAGTVLASRYRIIGLVGKGGMGEVYKAEDLQLSQVVALKFLPESVVGDEDMLARFRGEVRNARQVSHVNVCRVFDIGEIDGRHFLSMEFVDGDDLSDLLTRVGRFTSERAVEVSRQLCVGMEAIHKAGILHRDFKPANIIIDKKGVARITDFGIAGIESEIAKDGIRAGTPAYMAPEQINGKEVSARSDIYALGLVIYEIFTAKQAFIADNVMELIKKHQTETPTNPSQIVKDIDPLVESVIAQCLEKDPKDRPKSALHVAMALPGGNPLQIALDAGQTPTPEMIAASPKKGALKPKVALAWFAFFVVAALAIVYFQGFYTINNRIPFDRSPQVLAENTKRMIKSFGYPDKPADIKYHVRANWDFIDWAAKNGAMSNTAERLRTGQPAVVNLLYRQSPEPLRAWDNRQVEWNDPPLTIPGMVSVLTDTTGRLIEFNAVPPRTTENRSEPARVDWSKFFVEAGLDLNKFETTEPQWTPLSFADERTAWKGTMADWADIPIRIEAAAFQGRPVYFRVVFPWDVTPQQSLATFGNRSLFVLVIASILLIGVVVLVWHNIKNGRADLRGTAKVVLFLMVAWLGVFLFMFDHVFTSSQEFSVLGEILRQSLYISIFFGFIYCALEPFVRRWWSEYLISWSRLLAGDFRDPMVGRDILIGGAASYIAYFMWLVIRVVNEFGFGAKREILGFRGGSADSFLDGMVGFFKFLADSVPIGLGFLAIFLIVYFFTRNKKITIVLSGMLLTAFIVSDAGANGVSIVWVYVAIAICLGMIVFNRFGIVALISTNFFLSSITILPLTFDPASIVFPQTVATLVILVAIMAYAAYISIGGAKMFGGKSLLGD